MLTLFLYLFRVFLILCDRIFHISRVCSAAISRFRAVTRSQDGLGCIWNTTLHQDALRNASTAIRALGLGKCAFLCPPPKWTIPRTARRASPPSNAALPSAPSAASASRRLCPSRGRGEEKVRFASLFCPFLPWTAPPLLPLALCTNFPLRLYSKSKLARSSLLCNPVNAKTKKRLLRNRFKTTYLSRSRQNSLRSLDFNSFSLLLPHHPLDRLMYKLSPNNMKNSRRNYWGKWGNN